MGVEVSEVALIDLVEIRDLFFEVVFVAMHACHSCGVVTRPAYLFISLFHAQLEIVSSIKNHSLGVPSN